MPTIQLKYGSSSIDLSYCSDAFEVLRPKAGPPLLADLEIGSRLDDPINALPMEEVIEPGKSVLLVVPDATRQTAAGQMVNLMVRRLIANGILPHDIRIIFSTGIHRRVTDDEKAHIVTPFVAQRIKMLDHEPRDLAAIVSFGETADGIPVLLNRALLDHDHVMIVGGISFHYFAGFTGGRKLICPGLASSKTISESHRLAFDFAKRTRRAGVEAGRLDGNPVHEAFMRITAATPPTFAVNSIVDDAGTAVDMYFGDWVTSHRRACEVYAGRQTIGIDAKRPLVLVSCGGYPHDINLIQAHKALESASNACTPGGTIVLLAECRDGLGRDDFLKWFDAPGLNGLAELLCSKYQVNGQTAWSLLSKTERFDVRVVTTLDHVTLEKMRMKRTSLEEVETLVASTNGYIIPDGAKVLIGPTKDEH